MKESSRILMGSGQQEKRLLELSVETSEQHLRNAKLTHEKISRQIDMRTTTLASIAGNIFSEMMAAGKACNVLTAVGMAEEILSTAEARASKAAELQNQLEGK